MPCPPKPLAPKRGKGFRGTRHNASSHFVAQPEVGLAVHSLPPSGGIEVAYTPTRLVPLFSSGV